MKLQTLFVMLVATVLLIVMGFEVVLAQKEDATVPPEQHYDYSCYKMQLNALREVTLSNTSEEASLWLTKANAYAQLYELHQAC